MPQATSGPQPLYLTIMLVDDRGVVGRQGVEDGRGYGLVTYSVKDAEKVLPMARGSRSEGAARATAAKLRMTWNSMTTEARGQQRYEAEWS